MKVTLIRYSVPPRSAFLAMLYMALGHTSVDVIPDETVIQVFCFFFVVTT